MRIAAAILLVPFALAACGAESAPQAAPEAAQEVEPEAEAAPAALALTLTGMMDATPDDDDVCLIGMDGENRLERDAVNVQVAYTARTESQGTISEYIRLGDFAAGETRSGRMFVSASCGQIVDLKLSRAVCTHMLDDGATESCADAVTLDGGGVVDIRE